VTKKIFHAAAFDERVNNARCSSNGNDNAAEFPKGQMCSRNCLRSRSRDAGRGCSDFLKMNRWTYRELNERANRFAEKLRALGVAPEMRVGICVERSLNTAVGLMGILKAGGCYLPLDPTYPKERLNCRIVIVNCEWFQIRHSKFEI